MKTLTAYLLATLVGALANPFNEYINHDDGKFAWKDTGDKIDTLLGGTGYMLNVTSLQWLDESRAVGPNGALWTHQVLVVVPKNLEIKNRATIYITGGCNEHPSMPKKDDEDLLLVDMIAHGTKSIAVALFQIPNCHIIYPSDPTHAHRSEDAMIAWAWKEFLATNDTEWLPRFPMAKAAFKAMEAAQDFASQKQFANIDGWMVAGASKRGWTTWMVGAATCPTCPNVVGLIPLVPIAPSILKDLHHQYQSYGGWTFAFNDYYKANITGDIDTPLFKYAMSLVDPINYSQRLARLPKNVVVSSDDEFMMMEWTNIWWGGIAGETLLTIANNAEHSLITGLPEVVSEAICFTNSVFRNGTRPSFTATVDKSSGEITVTIPSNVNFTKVVLRHADTFSTKLRDFRWVRLASPQNGECKFPEIPLKKSVFGGGNCLAPIIWSGKDLHATSPGVFKASVPKRAEGWTGFYVEVYFPPDTDLPHDQYKLTSPGMVWPQTLPFPDCHGEECFGHLV